MNTTNEKYDVILIGSGIGALTNASLLAQLQNKRVLVLERHFKVGGFTHTFKRGKFEWDVGLHYVGEMQAGSRSRAIFDYITRGGVKWNQMPDVFDRFVYPDFTFDAQAGESNLRRNLIRQFPHEEAAIAQYFSDLKAVTAWFQRYMVANALPNGLKPISYLMSKFGSKLALMTTGEYLNKHIQDKKLKAVLVSQWGDYGLPPGQSAFVGHAMIAGHYLNGGYYPAGGSKTIADSIMPIVKERGGQFLVNHHVNEIILKNGKAIGVRATEKRGKSCIDKEFFGDVVISNVGAYITYTQLLPAEYTLPFADEINNFPTGTANVTLYLGAKKDPRSMGFNGENYWIYNGYNHDQIYADKNELINSQANHCYLSFPSLKKATTSNHTMEIIAPIDFELFQQWADQPWKNRGAVYEAAKERIANALIDFVDGRFPGFKDLIEYKELSTPLTAKFFTGHRGGNIYGLPVVPKRYQARWLGPHTPVKNLYLTGSDAGVHGIVGAMMSAVVTTSLVMGTPKGMATIFSEAMRFSADVPDLTHTRPGIFP